MNTLVKCRKCGEPNWLVKNNNEKCAKCNTILRLGVTADPIAQSETASGGLWRDGELLVMATGNGLLKACVKCGTTQDLHEKRVKLTYFKGHNILISILISIPFLLLGGGWAVQYTVQPVDVSLCPQHKSNWLQGLKESGKLFLAGFALQMAAIIPISLPLGEISFLLTGLLSMAGFVCLIVSAWRLVKCNDPLRVRSHKDNYLWLVGADESYLKMLPKWVGK